jgi:predicted MFS family arabinose efflux permease
MEETVPRNATVTTETSVRRRSLLAGCSAHAVHDGLTDVIYVLLPLWQAQFGLSLAQVGLLRGAYSGMMAGFQLLASRAARRFGRERLLVLGGLGASTQHPLASSMITDSHAAGGGVKQALSHYNFAGDIGKAVIPGLMGVLLVAVSWRTGATLLGVLGVAAAVLLWWLIPSRAQALAAGGKAPKLATGNGSPGGLRALLMLGMLDSAVRMGFLTFLPFLLRLKGAGTAGIGLALTLLFVGGAFGKLLCGYLGARIGLLKTVSLTEAGTALLIVLAVVLPYSATLVMLPLLGLALNGTSSVLYGVVPELAAAGKHEQAFALFYTGTIGGGALAPVVFGRLGDVTGVPTAVVVLAATLLLTLPLAWRVNKGLVAE